MYFGTKSYLKSNHYHTAKHVFLGCVFLFILKVYLKNIYIFN